jgi:hypothetical protein
MADKQKINYPLRLTVIAILALLILKIFFFCSNRNILYLISFFQDSFLLIINYFFFIYGVNKSPRLVLPGKIVFFTLFMVLGAVSFVYTIFLEDLITLPVNLFCITIDHITFFIKYFLDLKLVLITTSGIGLMLILARFFPFKLNNTKRLSVIAIILTLLFIPTVIRPSLNPLVSSAIEQYGLSIKTNHNILKMVNQSVADNEKHDQFKFLNKAFDTIPHFQIKYNRIVILVMESINYKKFINESSADSNSFYNQHKKNISLFKNYYTLNLDSYTSILSMLNSVFIPYQAYVNDTKFSFVNKRNNLIRFLNYDDFKTLFLTSYGKQQERFLPDANDWIQQTYMDSISGNPKYVSITSNKIEYACEDLSVFDDMMDFLKTNRKAFVLQEMVYGHTVAWKQKTGIETMEYYNQYFNKTINELKKNNLLDSTLIVVVSDHGPRNEPYNIENYHIPLLFYSNDIYNSTNSEFLSHIDFKDILLETISDFKYVPTENDLYIVGNSGEMIYGTIKKDGKYVFINNRMRAPQTNTTVAEVLSFNKNFLSYRNYFEYLKETTDTVKPKRKIFNFDLKQLNLKHLK